MKIRTIFHYFSFFVVASALTPPIKRIQIIDSKEIPTHPLCDLGCKCPGNDQNLLLLDCSQVGMNEIPTSLQFEPPVAVVNFQSNHIGKLSMDTFSMGDSVEELDLSLNEIDSIANATFSPFSILSLLRISHNRLSALAPGLLEGLENLRVLEVGHNTIQKVYPSTFQDTPMLQELRMQYNPIFDLPEDMFHYLPMLKKLDLQDTGLVVLPNHVFTPTPHLNWLSLASNAFEKVPEEALAQAPMLESLDLSGNDFLYLAPGDFRHLSKVSLLYLNNLSRLRRIEKDALAGLESLNTFSCSYNPKLEYVDQEAFGSLNSTLSTRKTSPHEQLYLRQNALRTLKSPLEIDTWSSLSFVDLADNPWKCDCNLMWMRQLKKETQENIICESPQHLRGRPFVFVSSSELRCEERWAITTFILVISSMVVFGLVVLATSAVVCSRTPVGLYVRAKKQFSYAKVDPKTETVDLEWDPSADI